MRLDRALPSDSLAALAHSRRLAALYPKRPIDLGSRVAMLPSDGMVPGMPGLTWISTPGHSLGHVSFYRARDRALIAGDAFVTTKQESALAVLMQRPELHGPPMYFTPDWLAHFTPPGTASGHHRFVWNLRLPLPNVLDRDWSIAALIKLVNSGCGW